MTEGYVYRIQKLPNTPQGLDPVLIAHLGEPVVHWVADKAALLMDEGLPESWRERGAVFGPKGELRWWQADGVFHALLIADEPLDEPLAGLSIVPGTWHREAQSVLLQNLNEPRVKPNFSTYPHDVSDGVMEVQVFYRDGVPVFTSPRRLLKIKEGK